MSSYRQALKKVPEVRSASPPPPGVYSSDFFFQAEDGIRDRNVTGVQTCALPISHTSTLIAMLVEQGTLSWDDPVDKYLPSFAGIAVREKSAAARTPKVRELLSHTAGDRKSTRLNSSHVSISYAVFCLKKKTNQTV